MYSEERAARWQEYFIELLNEDSSDIPTRRKNQHWAEPLISEVNQEDSYKAIVSHKNWKALGLDKIAVMLIK